MNFNMHSRVMEDDEIEIVCVSNNVGTQTGNDVQTDDNWSPDPILVSMFTHLYTVLVLFAGGLNLPGRFIHRLSENDI